MLKERREKIDGKGVKEIIIQIGKRREKLKFSGFVIGDRVYFNLEEERETYCEQLGERERERVK